MILNVLGFVSSALHMYSEYFEYKPLQILIREGALAAHFNDDSLGRTLDELFDAGVSELFERFVLKTLKKLNIKPKSLRVDTTLDTTSFHVDGQYDVEEDQACVRLEYGYSRDGHPELK